MTREYCAPLEPRPDDPSLGLVELYKNDPRDTKVNLGVGVYLNNDGKLPLMKAVGAAEKRLAERRAPHGYIPMSGLPGYCAAVQKLVFGADNEAVLSPPSSPSAGPARFVSVPFSPTITSVSRRASSPTPPGATTSRYSNTQALKSTAIRTSTRTRTALTSKP